MPEKMADEKRFALIFYFVLLLERLCDKFSVKKVHSDIIGVSWTAFVLFLSLKWQNLTENHHLFANQNKVKVEMKIKSWDSKW